MAQEDPGTVLITLCVFLVVFPLVFSRERSAMKHLQAKDNKSPLKQLHHNWFLSPVFYELICDAQCSNTMFLVIYKDSKSCLQCQPFQIHNVLLISLITIVSFCWVLHYQIIDLNVDYVPSFLAWDAELLLQSIILWYSLQQCGLFLQSVNRSGFDILK